MKPTLTLFTALLLTPLAALHATEAAKAKPNIIFILVDDMPYAGPSVTGNTLLQTPHLDRIAQKGMIFSRAYTEPLCGPSHAHDGAVRRTTRAHGQCSRRASLCLDAGAAAAFASRCRYRWQVQ